jgi:hypothetical protein
LLPAQPFFGNVAFFASGAVICHTRCAHLPLAKITFLVAKLGITKLADSHHVMTLVFGFNFFMDSACLDHVGIAQLREHCLFQL